MLEQSASFIEQGLSLNTVGILFSLIAMETVLSADNAVALAALVQHLPEPEHQRRALNWGLAGAFGLRIVLVLAATQTIRQICLSSRCGLLKNAIYTFSVGAHGVRPILDIKRNFIEKWYYALPDWIVLAFVGIMLLWGLSRASSTGNS